MMQNILPQQSEMTQSRMQRNFRQNVYVQNNPEYSNFQQVHRQYQMPTQRENFNLDSIEREKYIRILNMNKDK
jgi:hypothetical protein